MEKQTGAPFAPRRERGVDSFRRSVRRGAKQSGGIRLVARGVLLASSITIICVALFALLLGVWNASDRAVTAVNQVVKFVSILAGVAAAMKGADASAMRGAVVGFLYMLLGIVVCSLLSGQTPNLTAYLADLGMGLAAGGLFGMILLKKG